MSESTIIYTPGGPPGQQSITLPLGRLWNVEREGNCQDVLLHRHLAHDCPLSVDILIRTDGPIVLWGTSWFQTRETNTYWHFANTREGHLSPTRGQMNTLERMFLGLVTMPGGLGSTLGAPVARWAFDGQTPQSIAQKHGRPVPVMNG